MATERGAHPMEDWLRETTIKDAREFLARRPPTAEQADRLAVEELVTWDREVLLRLLSWYRDCATDPKPERKGWSE